MDIFQGLFTFYQDTLNGSLYMEIHKNQLDHSYFQGPQELVKPNLRVNSLRYSALN